MKSLRENAVFIAVVVGIMLAIGFASNSKPPGAHEAVTRVPAKKEVERRGVVETMRGTIPEKRAASERSSPPKRDTQGFDRISKANRLTTYILQTNSVPGAIQSLNELRKAIASLRNDSKYSSGGIAELYASALKLAEARLVYLSGRERIEQRDREQVQRDLASATLAGRRAVLSPALARGLSNDNQDTFSSAIGDLVTIANAGVQGEENEAQRLAKIRVAEKNNALLLLESPYRRAENDFTAKVSALAPKLSSELHIPLIEMGLDNLVAQAKAAGPIRSNQIPPPKL